MNLLLEGVARNAECTACKLHTQADAENRCVTGSGPTVNPTVVVVTKFPLAEKSKSRKELETYFTEAGIKVRNIMWLSALKCRVWDLDPTKTDMKACRPYLEKELSFLQPKYVLAIGGEALFATLGKSGIMKYRGQPFDGPYRSKVFATISPAMVARNPGSRAGFVADLKYFARMAKGQSGADNTIPYHLPTNVRTGDTKEALRSLLSDLQRASVCAYDIETTSAEPYTEGAAIVSIAMTMSEKGDMSDAVVWRVPLYHPESKWRNRWRHVLQIIGKWLIRVKKLVAHNAKFDSKWMRHFGVMITPTFDTIVAAAVDDENRVKGLKPLCQQLLGADPWGIDTLDLLNTPLAEVLDYNGLDTWHDLRLYFYLKKSLLKQPRKAKLFANLLMPAVQELIDVERHGVYVDRQRFTDNWHEVKEKLNSIHEQLEAFVPDPRLVDPDNYDLDLTKIIDKKTGEFKVNWTASNFARWFLFEYLGLPVIKRGKKKDNGAPGDPSMAEGVLMELAEESPVAKLLLERIEWNKMDIAFFTPYEQQIDNNSRIHTTFKPWGTVTGRLSSGKEDAEKITSKQQIRGVNLQQVPRNSLVRGIFGAQPGYYFIEADYSQIELRIAAWLANERNMLSLYARGEDIHMAMAMLMTGKPASQVTKEERKRAKAVNFGFLYGMGWLKFIETAWLNYGVRVTQDESKAFRKTFFEGFPGLPVWHGKQRRLAREYKRVETPMGRVRHLPDIDSPDESVRAEQERQAINSPVQGCASDMALLSLVHLSQAFREQGLRAHAIGTVHDAVNFEVHADEVPYVLPLIKETMENLPLDELFGVNMTVPIIADLKVGKHWGGATEVPEGIVLAGERDIRKWVKESVPA